jgi:enoyl-CoA hydratase/carnithine racemase
MSSSIVIERKDALLEVVLNSPETGNVITEDMGQVLEQALRDVGSEVKLVRLRANGEHFCRGRKSPPIDRATATALAFRQKIAEGPLCLYQAFRACHAPIIGVVQGEALGVGCALAALCDLTIASETAIFAVPELDHGIPPTLVISALAGRVPYKAISHLVYSRLRISARQAAEIGIVGQIVPQDSLGAASDALVDLMLKNTAAALQGVKEYLRHAARLEPDAQSSLASSIIATVLSSQNR